MNRLARAADRFAAGSSALARRIAARLAAWVARARRDDLTGWRATLGCWLRLAVLGLGLYLLWRLVRAFPNLLWLLTGAWLITSWRSGKPAPAETPQAPGEEASATAELDTLRALLLDLMGEGSGVHLRTVLTHLQEHGQWEGRSVTDLRLRLERLRVPVDRGVKVGGTPTWGVRRRDLEALSQAEPQDASTEPSTAA